jgi:hypothetical protein
MAEVLRSVAVCAVLLGLGSAAGWQLRALDGDGAQKPLPAETVRTSTPEARPEARERVIIEAVDPTEIRAAVRTAISEELAAARMAEEAEAEPAPEALVTIDSGHRYIAAAIGSGRWGTEQVSHVRELGVGLSGEQYQELLRPLTIAINEGRVQVEVDGPAF